MTPISDSQHYSGVNVPLHLLRLFVNAARFYAGFLEQDIATYSLDEELAKLLDERTLKSFQVSREIERVREIANRAEELIPRAESMGGVDMPMTHGFVRRLKAICLLYIGELENRRNAAATKRSVSALGLEVLDTKLLELRESMEKGVFRDAEPVTLLVAPEAAQRAPQAALAVTSGPSGRMVPIDIVDQELRERCLDMFNAFSEANQPERFDTIIVEATRILENRVRKIASLGPEASGLELVSTAFGGKTPRLRVSSHAPEQEGLHHLFRGIAGFIRNPIHHRLENIERERAIQIMGFIDYLLYVAETAEVATT